LKNDTIFNVKRKGFAWTGRTEKPGQRRINGKCAENEIPETWAALAGGLGKPTRIRPL